MNKKILIPIIIAGIALIVLFVLGINGLSVPPKKPMKEHNHAPAMPPKIEAASFESVLTAEKNKLHPQIQGEINALEEKVAQASSDNQKIIALENLAKKWVEIKRPSMGAYYFVEAGILENSEKKLTFASHLFNEAILTESKPEVKQWMAETAEKALKKVLEGDEHHVEAKMELATLYIEGMGQPMLGVAQLQEIVKNDSANFDANLVLGKMAIESNQLEKAVERGMLILKYHPASWEAYVLLAEAHVRQGMNDKAIGYLTEAKKHNKNPDFIKDVDQFIDKIKE